MLSFLRDRNVMVTSHMSLNTLLASIVMGISVFSYGFETGVLDTVQAMKFFVKKFGEYDEASKTYDISASHLAYLNSFPLILYAAGVILASQVGERWGRRTVFLMMNLICLTGVAVCYTAKTYGQFLAGRMIVQMHVGMEAWLIPMFQAEIVPAAIRGSMVVTYTFNHVFATFLSSIVTNATSKFPDDSSWKIPVACMFAFPSLTLLLSFLVPESPRWLLRKGKSEHASRSLYYLNSAKPGFVVDDQLSLLRNALEESEHRGKWTDLVKGSNKMRTFIACVAPMCSQLTGQSFASTYGAIFIKSINVMDTFQATLIKRGILCVGALVPIFLVDRIGRRSIVFVFGSLSAASLMAMGAIASVKPETLELKKAVVAMAIFFPFCYISSFAAVMQVLTSEVPHITLRDKTGMISWSISNICNFTATFTLPYLLYAPYANLGPRVAFIYGSTSTLAVIWTYFYMPDLTGRSLEEVNELFDAKVPAWRTRGWVSNSAMATLTALENSKDGAVTDYSRKQEVDTVEYIETERK